MDCSPLGSPVHGISQARILYTVVGCHFLQQEIFLIQGSNTHLLHYRQILYHWATRDAPCIYIHTHTHIYIIYIYIVSLVAQMVKDLPAMWETQVQSLVQEDPLEKEMATHSSMLAWKIPWTEKTGGLQSMGSQRVRLNWATNTYTNTHIYIYGLDEFQLNYFKS